MKIKIFGEQTKEIKEGQTFIAKIDSVEGRTVVILESKDGQQSITSNMAKTNCGNCKISYPKYDMFDLDDNKLYCKSCILRWTKIGIKTHQTNTIGDKNHE